MNHACSIIIILSREKSHNVLQKKKEFHVLKFYNYKFILIWKKIYVKKYIKSVWEIGKRHKSNTWQVNIKVTNDKSTTFQKRKKKRKKGVESFEKHLTTTITYELTILTVAGPGEVVKEKK